MNFIDNRAYCKTINLIQNFQTTIRGTLFFNEPCSSSCSLNKMCCVQKKNSESFVKYQDEKSKKNYGQNKSSRLFLESNSKFVLMPHNAQVNEEEKGNSFVTIGFPVHT